MQGLNLSERYFPQSLPQMPVATTRNRPPSVGTSGKGSSRSSVWRGLSITAAREVWALTVYSSGLGIQHARHAFRVTRNDRQIGPCRLIGFATPLFPVAQRAERDVIACRKFLLRQAQRAPKGLDARHAFHADKVFFRQWPSIGIGHSRGFNFLIAHRTDAVPIGLVDGRSRFSRGKDFDKRGVIPAVGSDSSHRVRALYGLPVVCQLPLVFISLAGSPARCLTRIKPAHESEKVRLSSLERRTETQWLHHVISRDRPRRGSRPGRPFQRRSSTPNRLP